jgi:hypothetical protein
MVTRIGDVVEVIAVGPQRELELQPAPRGLRVALVRDTTFV